MIAFWEPKSGQKTCRKKVTEKQGCKFSYTLIFVHNLYKKLENIVDTRIVVWYNGVKRILLTN